MNFGVNIAKIDDIMRMLQSNDFETEKLGLSLALEEFPKEVLEHVTGWKKYVLLECSTFDYDTFLKCKDIIDYALNYPDDDIYFLKCIVMVYTIALSYHITTII